MNKNIQTLLTSNKVDEVLKGIELFETTGSLKELPLLLSLLNSNNSETFENKIVELVSNTKEAKANEIIIEAIYNNKEKGNVRALLQMAWQSSLNFTQNLALFTEIFIERDYITALEAFTLIENIWQDYNFEEEHKILLIDTLKAKINQFDEHKKILGIELIKILES